jgi:hypothetical protein
MRESIAQRNKAFVIEAFETLFNRKDFAAAEKFPLTSPNVSHLQRLRESGFLESVSTGRLGLKRTSLAYEMDKLGISRPPQ